MMKLTPELKQHLVTQGWIKADADDAAVRKEVGARIMSGDLTSETLSSLTKGVVPVPGKTALEEAVAKALQTAIAPKVVTAEDAIAKSIKAHLEAADKAASSLVPTGAPGGGMTEILAKHGALLSDSDSLEKHRTELANATSIRVKGAYEQYSGSRTAAIYPMESRKTGMKNFMGGERASIGGHDLDLPSDRDKAVAQAYFKFALDKGRNGTNLPRQYKMTDHDKDLLMWSLHNSNWSGVVNDDDDGYDDKNIGTWYKREKLRPEHIKALLDDTTSGGIEIAPIEFDDMLITVPVLYGEIFPLVEVVNITRGRRVKGGTVNNPNLTWGIGEGTPIQPFNTSAFVGAFDTAIYNVVSAFEIGLDFEEDTPTNIGQTILQKYGEKMQQTLDDVVVVGDGVTQPLGVFNAQSVLNVPADGGPSGPWTVSDLEGLLLGVQKQFRNAKGRRNVFFGGETTYRRVRSVPIQSGDERRVFGTTHEDYNVMQVAFKIDQQIPNSKLGFGNMGGYRMYRRLGMNVRVETQGQTLALKNTKLIVVRARFGGQPTLPGYFSIITNGMS